MQIVFKPLAQRRLAVAMGIAIPLLLASCHQPSCPKLQEPTAALQDGHQATVTCLRSERAQTDGSELRCEDWNYVQKNYLQKNYLQKNYLQKNYLQKN